MSKTISSVRFLLSRSDSDLLLMNGAARNVFLLSFLCEANADMPPGVLWNIYYSRYLSDADMNTLQAQARKLLEFSTSLQEWHDCPYGKILRFCDQRTFDCTRTVWKQYDNSVSVKGTDLYLSNFRAAMRQSDAHKGKAYGPGSAVYTAAKSAAPLYISLGNDVQAALADMWAQEIAGSNTSPAQYPNPLFATALSDSVTLAFPSNPLLSFHLATAGVKLTALSPLRLDASDPDDSTHSKLVQAAKLQFAGWTTAFKKLSANMVVRYVAADCFAFCQTLQHSLSTGKTCANFYRRQLDPRPLVLDDAAYGKAATAPRQFDVIDTSNLSDHSGSLNLLVSAGPLLKEKPSSTLYVESMARGTAGDKEKFETLLCGHTRTLSLLLGLAPIEHWTNASAVSYYDELAIAIGERAELGKPDAGPNTQYRLVWKLSSCVSGNTPAALSLDPPRLADILLKVYLDMFSHESPSVLTAAIADQSKIASFAYPPYHRGSFVALVKAVCGRARTDAAEVGRLLIKMIEKDSSLLFGSNYAHGLALDMSWAGVYSDAWLTTHIRRDDPSKGTFCKWKEIPEAVAVTLVVPPSRWQPVFKEASDRGVGLTLEGHLRVVGSWHNMYANVQITFGTVTASGSRDSDDYTLSVEEDARGSQGESPLVASFYASAAALQIDKGTSQVALCLQSTVQNCKLFAPKLGMPMAIFETGLEDSDHVHVTKHCPGQQGLPVVGSSALQADPAATQSADITLTPEVDDATGGIVAIAGRADITSDEGKRLLEERVPVTLQQTSPFTIDVVFGDRVLVQTIVYRAPVTRDNIRTRIARKSSYIEVIARLAEPAVSSILEDYIYPTVADHGPSPGSIIPVALNIPALNLDRLPIIDVSDKKSLSFLTPLASSIFSDRERRLREGVGESGTGSAPPVRLNFKESLFLMLMVSSGLQGGQTGLFAFALPETGIHMLLLVSALRLDGANASVVLDAAVIPMTVDMLKDDEFQAFLIILRTLECCSITVDDAELVTWKKVLPALAERCRTWSHSSGCEYSARGTVPLSTSAGGQVLCSCGRGRLPEGFVGVPDWETTARKYATRIAISPTFAVPFVEDVVDREFAKEMWKDPGQGKERCRNCGATESKKGGALKKCMRCLEVRYCSAECQKKDWRKHRMECKEAEVYGMDLD